MSFCIVVDGVAKNGASKGRTAKSVPAEVVRLSGIVKGLGRDSGSVKSGLTLYRNDAVTVEENGEMVMLGGESRKFDNLKEVKKVYTYCYNLSRKNEEFSHLAPHIFKVSDSELYLYFTDKTL